MKWNIEEKNLVFIEHQYLLNDLYLCNNYDNVIRSEYGGQLFGRRQLEISCPKEKQLEISCPKEDNQRQVIRKETTRDKLFERKQFKNIKIDIKTRKKERK